MTYLFLSVLYREFSFNYYAFRRHPSVINDGDPDEVTAAERGDRLDVDTHVR
jgi:hypothetical protein